MLLIINNLIETNAFDYGGGGGSRTLFPQDKSLSINSF